MPVLPWPTQSCMSGNPTSHSYHVTISPNLDQMNRDSPRVMSFMLQSQPPWPYDWRQPSYFLYNPHLGWSRGSRGQRTCLSWEHDGSVPWRLTHWGRDKMDAISQTPFSNAFFFNESVWIPIKISSKFVPKGPINNIPALVQIMAWRRPGDKPLSESMMVSLPTHICVTRLQWVNERFINTNMNSLLLVYSNNA